MRIHRSAAVALLILAAASVCTAGTFEDLLKKTPSGANVLMVVNVEQILASDFAKSRDSAEKMEKAFEEREILIPPNAKHFAMAAQIDLERHSTIWEAALMELTTPPDFDKIAERIRGKVEMIGGAKAIGTRRTFIVDLGDQQVGLLLPSSRQHTARWLKETKAKEPSLTSYLAKASSYSDTAGTDIILAVDLADVLPEQYLADKLREGELFKDKAAAIGPTAKLLATVQGVRLGIKIGEKCYGKLIVDFADDPSSLGDLAKPMLLGAIGNNGLMLEEFADWKATVGKKSIAIEGELSDEGMRRIMSLVAVPSDSIGAVAPNTAEAPKAEKTPVSAVAEASRSYFKSIDKQISSLKLKKQDAKTFGQVAQWINNAARRIDRMPTLDVDEELLAYGSTTTNELRQMASALQGIGINSAERSSAVYGGETYYSGWDGYYYSGTDHQAEKRQIRAEEKAAGARSAQEIAAKMAQDAAAIRQQMTKKYKLQF